MMEKLKAFYERLALGHIAEGRSTAKKRAIRITSMLQVVMFVIPTLLLPQVLFVEPPENLPYSMTLFTILFVGLFIGRLLLYKRQFTWSAIVTLLNVNIHIAGLAFAFADDPAYLGFLIMALLPFLIIDSYRKPLQWLFVLVPSALFLTHQVYFRVYQGSGYFGPPKWVGEADYFVGPIILLIGFLLLLIKQFVNAVETAEENLELEHEKSEKLIRNILPEEIAEELKVKGITKPKFFESATVCFTDFQGFTKIAEKLSPTKLVNELDRCFSRFDEIMEKHNLEKLKTIGDSYMFAGGIPTYKASHAVDCVLAALEIQDFMNTMKQKKSERGLPYWELRLGIHTGSLIAGVIGSKKFAYDVWSDTVNTASRCESSGVPGRINISGTTYELVKDYFECEHRGKVEAKNKGVIDMYFVNGSLFTGNKSLVR